MFFDNKNYIKYGLTKRTNVRIIKNKQMFERVSDMKKTNVLGEELFFLGVLGLILFFTCMAGFGTFGRERTQEVTSVCVEKEKIVTSVLIEKDSSLWEIASQYYTDEYVDVHALIDEIKQSNGLCRDVIHEGAYIIVPHYVSSASY